MSELDDCGDYVVVRNATKVRVTGKKQDQLVYRHHTMFPGGLKEIPFKTMMEKKPENVSFCLSVDSRRREHEKRRKGKDSVLQKRGTSQISQRGFSHKLTL